MRRPRRPWLLLTVGLVACFAWVVVFDDHESDLVCTTGSRGRIDCQDRP